MHVGWVEKRVFLPLHWSGCSIFHKQVLEKNLIEIDSMNGKRENNVKAGNVDLNM